VSAAGTHKRILEIVLSDATFERMEQRGQTVWQGRCLHCNAHLTVSASGEPISRATIEHILPRSHGGTEALENLGLACARCNHQKGVRHDNRRRGDPRLMEIVEALRAKRMARWREPSRSGDLSHRS
jgi:5-methylcytosine-specific restriction endonuclease McrA